MITTLDFNGNPYLGVYAASTEALTLVPKDVPKRVARAMGEALGTEVVVTTLSGSTVLGALFCGNSHGVVVTNLATDGELAAFGDVRAERVPEPSLNALGNNVLCNDQGAVVNPSFGAKSLAVLEEVLGVPATKGTIARLRTVGSSGVATNRGCIVHPQATERERDVVQEALGVPVALSTANYGTPQVGACVLATSEGAVVGSRTTPIELGRIEEGLRLY